VPGIVGIAEVVREAYPDHTAFDPKTRYYDPKSDPEHPRWFMVDIAYVRHLERTITLAELKALAAEDPAGALADLPLVRRGNRLSIMPVTEAQWQHILALETVGA
jgi:predicted RNA-binding protein with PUA-like domain